MGIQMVTIDPMLSFLAATVAKFTVQIVVSQSLPSLLSNFLCSLCGQVIPCMCVVIASLGKRLRQMSKEAHLSLAMLTAYLNDVWFSSNCLLTYQKRKSTSVQGLLLTLQIFFLGSSVDAHREGKQWGTQGDVEIPKVSS
jgi:hypothetical protein